MAQLGRPESQQLACLINEEGHKALYLMFNAGVEGVAFHLPPVPNGARWRLAVDTYHEAPQDLFAEGEEPLVDQSQAYQIGPRSSAILLMTNGKYPRRRS